jgi:3-(3-hydroxy-phenyl)propionate hydroxylase
VPAGTFSLNTDPRYSVVIIGAGPTGLTIANLLGKAGVSTLLVEQRSSTIGEPRAVSIDDESLRTVQAMGLLPEVEQDLVHGYGSEYRSPSGRVFLTVKPAAQPYGHPRRNAFRQPLFEAQLRRGLKRYSCVHTRFGCKMLDFEQGEAGVSVSLESESEGSLRMASHFLIGCDGASSGTRAKLGFRLRGSRLDERWLIVDLENSPVSSKETLVFCNPARAGIALPGPHQTRRYEFKLHDGESESEILRAEYIQRMLSRHGAAPTSIIVRQTVYHFHARIADHWGKNRVWLACDAAHLMPPFAGQGMNSGLRGAFNLAWKLSEVVQGRIGPGLLATYEQERRPHVNEMVQLAIRMGQIMGPRSRPQAYFSRLLFTILGLWPAARSYFAEMKYKPPPRFRSGFLVESMLSPRRMVGKLFLQPPIETGPFTGSRLDDLIGPGFSLLGIEVDQRELDTLHFGPSWNALIQKRFALPVVAVPELALYRGWIFLIRPDRYVLAQFKAPEVHDVVRALNELLASMKNPFYADKHEASGKLV